MASRIEEVLMKRDGMTAEEARIEFEDLQTEFADLLARGEMEKAYDVCSSVGLEPDYVEDLI